MQQLSLFYGVNDLRQVIGIHGYRSCYLAYFSQKHTRDSSSSITGTVQPANFPHATSTTKFPQPQQRIAYTQALINQVPLLNSSWDIHSRRGRYQRDNRGDRGFQVISWIHVGLLVRSANLPRIYILAKTEPFLDLPKEKNVGLGRDVAQVTVWQHQKIFF